MEVTMFGLSKRDELKVDCVTASDRGLVRKENEDHVFVDGAKTLFAVADGMGGGSEGARASEIVCEELAKTGPCGLSVRVSGVEASVRAANDRILAYAREKGFKQMGSTVAVLVVEPENVSRAVILHVGDSRVYRVRGGSAELLTRDHTIGGQLSAFAKGGQAAELKSRANPLAHVLTRAVGVEPTVEIDRREVVLADGDRFLVCSDGVHDVVADSSVGEILTMNRDLGQAAEKLRDLVVTCGAPDNYSFVIVSFGGAK